MESKNKKLRSGYTTGACAAAAAKAASRLLLAAGGRRRTAEIPFPDGSRVMFRVHDSGYSARDKSAFASIIKDAGDDPDVTHGAEIRAEVSWNAKCGKRIAELESPEIIIKGGSGVGVVTKPGLAIPVGEPAINPVPRRMITAAVREAISEQRAEGREQGDTRDTSLPPQAPCSLLITVSVPAGEELAKKTLNSRLGIIGGISILGTTGIVRPLSTEAYTASITAGMDVAKALGRDVVVLSSGRTSEKAHMKKYALTEEAYVMMGDYLEFSLRDAKKHGFGTIHLCAQWAKMIKTAMSTPQTHVRHGAIEGKDAAVFLRLLGADIPRDASFNTVREIYDFLNSPFRDPHSVFSAVCRAAKQYAETVASGIPVLVSLVSYQGEIIADSE